MSQNALPRLNLALASTLGIDGSKQRVAGIVHLGIGAFHRGHQAVYTQHAMQKAGGDWHIVGVSLRSANVAKQLAPQDGLFTLVERGDSDRQEIISTVTNVLVASDSPARVLEIMGSPNIHIVTLTITEKGYCHDPASGLLNLEHPDIKHDLRCLDAPCTAIGFIVAAIQRRVVNKMPPLTIISCDNLPDNGALLKDMVLAFATQISTDLATTIDKQYSFPCTMVDRIVPATTADAIAQQSQKLGYLDEAMILTEPFSQWIIEDKFVGPRPAWDDAGALLVEDVRAFETMKLRLLNGSHSAIAYLGYLAHKTFVADFMQIPVFAEFVSYLMTKELLPSVDVPADICIEDYCNNLLIRFSNPHLHHRTYQIAMDGSQKLPQRLLNPLRFAIENRCDYSGICYVIAAWMHYVCGVDMQGESINIQDPLANELVKIAQQNSHSVQDTVSALLSFESVFGKDLNKNVQLQKKLCDCLSTLQKDQSIETTISRFMQSVQAQK
jgi:fructuronate reductase